MPSGVSLTRRVVRWRSWVPSWCSSACIWRETLPFGKAKKSAARKNFPAPRLWWTTALREFYPFLWPIVVHNETVARISHCLLFFLTSNAGFHNVVMMNVAISQQEKGGIALWERWIPLNRAYFSAIPFKVNRRCIGYLCLFLSHCRLLFLFMVAEFHF